MNRFLKRIHGLMQRLKTLKENPRDVARGYALGIFLATTPFIGMKIFIAVLISALLRWNKTASVVGVYHVNPITAPPFYALAFLVGKTVLGIKGHFIFPGGGSVATLKYFFAGTGNIFLSLLTGGLILGIPLTCIAFLLAKKFLLGKQQA